jgi:uncharacterized membrane-anchored protein YjiN (DUF445 family)
MRLGAWLAQPANASRVSRDLAAALDWVLRSGDGGALRSALGGTLRTAFEDVPVSRAIATLIEVLAEGPHAQALIDQLVQFGRTQLEHHRVSIRVRIHERSPWWIPKFIDQEIYDKLIAEVERLLDDIAGNPEHPARAEFTARLRSLQQSLAGDPALAAKSRALQQEVAARLDGWLKQLLLYLVENYRDALSEIVSETIERWDPHETSRRIELHIGRDLQFIRVNGTVVGGLVGLLLYLGWQVVA